VPGTWSWTWINTYLVVIKPNGTALAGSSLTGQWSCTNGNVVIAWSNGTTDHMSLSNDGRHIQGTNGLIRVVGERR